MPLNISEIKLKTTTYKDDIICIIVVCCFVIFLLSISWLKWGHPVIDCGREVYLPWQITEGKILYLDLFSYYGPLAYYILALCFAAFGATLNTAFTIGLIVNIGIFSLLYILSRKLLTPYQSCITVLTYIVIAAITPNLGGYEGTIFPYSYSSLLGVFLILLQIYFLLLKFEQNNNKYLYISAIFASLCISCKQDYALSSLLITTFFTLYLFNQKEPFKNIIIYWGLTLILPCLVYSIFLLYLPFKYYINTYLIPTYHLSIEHNKEVIVPFFSFHSAFLSLKFFIISSVAILLTTILLYFLVLAYFKAYNLLKKYISSVFIYIISLIILLYLLSEVYFFITVNFLTLDILINHLIIFSWFPMFISVIIIIYGYLFFFKGYKFSNSEAIFIFLSFTSICIAIRCWSYCFSTYYTLPLLICIMYLFLVKLPKLTSKLNIVKKDIAKIACFICVFLIVFIFGAKNCFIFQNMKYPVSTDRGTFITFPQYALGYNSAINYINENVSKDDKITCFPQETLLNFLTDRPTATVRIQYMMNEPIDLEQPMNQKDRERLLESKYIFVSNFPYFLPKKYYFGIDYHQKLYKFIQKHYTPVGIAGRYELKYKDADHGYGFLILKRNS